MDVETLLRRHPAIRGVELVGSRARGDETELSDWDFLIRTDDVAAVVDALPDLLAPLDPLAAQWDRLSEEATYYMLILRDGVKVDFVVQRPPKLEPPWVVERSSLAGIDAHLWDWILWLGGKQLRGDEALVKSMLEKALYEHLLAPLGAARPPQSIADAVELYQTARSQREREFGIDVSRELEHAVYPRLEAAGLV